MASIENSAEQIESLNKRVRELEDLLVSSVSADTIIIRPQRYDNESFGRIVEYLWDKKIPHNLWGHGFIELSRIAYEQLKKAKFDVQGYSMEEMNRICNEEMRD